MTTPFSLRVVEGMRQKGYSLRGLCRAAGLDPSFFSKVLAGKRSPPADEEMLREIARLLELNAAELIVSAGRIPMEWKALWGDPVLFDNIHHLASRAGPSAAKLPPHAPKHLLTAHGTARSRELAEELL